MNEEIYWENKYSVIDYINNVEVPHVYEVLCESYGFAEDDYDLDDAHDHIWEIIDGLASVIYNYQARKIAEAFGLCPFSDLSESTGEKFTSWNQMAFEIIEKKVHEKYADVLCQ